MKYNKLGFFALYCAFWEYLKLVSDLITHNNIPVLNLTSIIIFLALTYTLLIKNKFTQISNYIIIFFLFPLLILFKKNSLSDSFTFIYNFIFWILTLLELTKGENVVEKYLMIKGKIYYTFFETVIFFIFIVSLAYTLNIFASSVYFQFIEGFSFLKNSFYLLSSLSAVLFFPTHTFFLPLPSLIISFLMLRYSKFSYYFGLTMLIVLFLYTGVFTLTILVIPLIDSTIPVPLEAFFELLLYSGIFTVLISLILKNSSKFDTNRKIIR